MARLVRRVYATGLQTVKSALVSNLGLPLILTVGLVWRGPAFLLVLVLYFSMIEWCRSRTHVSLDEEKRRLSVTTPLLGSVHFDLGHFQGALMSALDSSRRVWEVLFILLASLLLAIEMYRFASGMVIRLFNELVAGMLLVLAFWMHQQRGYKLEMWFGVHSDWRRHVWSRRKVTFRGREEVLQELKRQVETAAGQAGE